MTEPIALSMRVANQETVSQEEETYVLLHFDAVVVTTDVYRELVNKLSDELFLEVKTTK